MLNTYIIWKCNRHSWLVAEKISWKTREFRLNLIRRNVVYNLLYWEDRFYNDLVVAIYKAGILWRLLQWWENSWDNARDLISFFAPTSNQFLTLRHSGEDGPLEGFSRICRQMSISWWRRFVVGLQSPSSYRRLYALSMAIMIKRNESTSMWKQPNQFLPNFISLIGIQDHIQTWTPDDVLQVVQRLKLTVLWRGHDHQ